MTIISLSRNGKTKKREVRRKHTKKEPALLTFVPTTTPTLSTLETILTNCQILNKIFYLTIFTSLYPIALIISSRALACVPWKIHAFVSASREAPAPKTFFSFVTSSFVGFTKPDTTVTTLFFRLSTFMRTPLPFFDGDGGVAFFFVSSFLVLFSSSYANSSIFVLVLFSSFLKTISGLSAR